MNIIEATKGVQKMRNGLREDFKFLFDKFTNLNSIRFVDFCRLWRENSFIFIFAFKMNENDLRELVEEAYQIVLDQFNSTVTSEWAVTTLYLIYCLYISHPIEPKVPIKLTLPKYKAFRSLFQASLTNQHIDACYIWLKLVSLGAFHMVARSKPFGPLMIRRSPVVNLSSSNGSSFARLSDFEPYIKELKNVHDDYNQLKQNLQGDDLSHIRELDLVKDDLFKEYERLMEQSSIEASKSSDQDENAPSTSRSCLS